MPDEPIGANIEHDAVAEQFQIRWAGQVARLEYRGGRRRIVFVHTEVPTALQGRGFADQLARAGLDFARAKGLRVIPACPFVAAFIRRHPEYQALVEQDGNAESP